MNNSGNGVGRSRSTLLGFARSLAGLEWNEVATFCRFMDDYGASVINHLPLKSWVANHINLVWELDSAGKPTHNFVEICIGHAPTIQLIPMIESTPYSRLPARQLTEH